MWSCPWVGRSPRSFLWALLALLCCRVFAVLLPLLGCSSLLPLLDYRLSREAVPKGSVHYFIESICKDCSPDCSSLNAEPWQQGLCLFLLSPSCRDSTWPLCSPQHALLSMCGCPACSGQAAFTYRQLRLQREARPSRAERSGAAGGCVPAASWGAEGVLGLHTSSRPTSSQAPAQLHHPYNVSGF